MDQSMSKRMRRPIVILACALTGLLSGCGGNDAPDLNETLTKDLLAPPPALIPDRFIGTWDKSAAACTAKTPGEMRLVIEPGLMRFYESLVKVQEVHPVAEQEAVDVDATSTGEGVTESRRYRLTPDGGNSVIVRVGESSVRRVRCPTR